MTASENPAESAATAEITVVRNAPEDTQTRQIIVYLDQQRMGELMFGDSMTFPIRPGTHTLRVDNTWSRKDLVLEIHPADRLEFVTSSTAGQFAWFLLGFLGAGPMQVSIERRAPSPGQHSSADH